MQILKKFFLLIIIVWLAILFFMPKKEIYYKLEEKLAEKSIKINEASIEEGLFSLNISNAEIYVKGIKMATVENLDFFTLLLYTNIEVENFFIDETLANRLPTKINQVLFSHIGLDPLNIKIVGKGDFGGVDGKIDLNKKVLRVDFNDSKAIKEFKPRLRRDDKGWYYETSL